MIEAEVDRESPVMGLLVDSVNQVVELAPDAIAPSPSFGTRARTDLLKGMGVVGSEFLLVIDVDRVLDRVDLLRPDVPARSA
jgi:purine-binding chemotaxis protein CheW